MLCGVKQKVQNDGSFHNPIARQPLCSVKVGLQHFNIVNMHFKNCCCLLESNFFKLEWARKGRLWVIRQECAVLTR